MVHFDIVKLEKELNELEAKTTEDGFWNDQKESNKILSDIKIRKSKVAKYKELSIELKNILELLELVEIEQDETLVEEITVNTKKIEGDIEKIKNKTL